MVKMVLITFFGLLVILFQSASAHNFLVFSPVFAHSHSVFMGNIADTLKEAGHNVTFLSLVVGSKLRNVSYTKSVEDVVYIETTDAIDQLTKRLFSGDFSKFWNDEGGVLDMIPSFIAFASMYEAVMLNLRNNTHVLDEIRKTRPKFDAIIFESFVFFGRAVQEYLDIPVFLPAIALTHDNKASGLFGEPVSPSFISGFFSNFGDQMSFQERMTNTVSFMLEKLILQCPTWKTLQDPNKTLEIETVFHRAPYMFINSNPYIDFPRPMLPKTIQIGGITVDVEALRSQKVDDKWNSILERQPHSVLVSFGSMLFSIHMPDTYKSNMVKVMKSFPNVTFIWKYESEDTSFAGGAANIVFSKWAPQTALLADSRLSAFLTHGGLGSVHELSYLGKPAILCPMFGDHFRNAKMLARHNGALEISKFDLANFENLRTAFQKIIFDGTFKKNAESLAKRLERQPVKPRELLVKHAEFAAEFGEQPGLDCNIRSMSYIQYYLLDVIAAFVAIIFSFLLTFYFLARCVWKVMTRKEKND